MALARLSVHHPDGQRGQGLANPAHVRHLPWLPGEHRPAWRSLASRARGRGDEVDHTGVDPPRGRSAPQCHRSGFVDARFWSVGGMGGRCCRRRKGGLSGGLRESAPLSASQRMPITRRRSNGPQTTARRSRATTSFQASSETTALPAWARSCGPCRL